MDSIYLRVILKKDIVTGSFPISDENMKIPNIAYNFSPTIRSKVTNYKKSVQRGIIPETCVCNMEKYVDFVDSHHGHVFTGNIDLIDNVSLRSLIKKGLNFREVPAPNKQLIIKNIASSLDSYINKISEKANTRIALFNNWKKQIICLVKSKLVMLQP